MSTKPIKYKVGRGHWRTKAQTRQILGLPKDADVPAHICKLPLKGLELMKTAVALKMLRQQQEREAFLATPHPSRYDDSESKGLGSEPLPADYDEVVAAAEATPLA